MMRRDRMATRVADVSETPLIRYSRWALAVTIACMPLYVVRYSIGPFPTTVLENLVLITIALYAVGRYQISSSVSSSMPIRSMMRLRMESISLRTSRLVAPG